MIRPRTSYLILASLVLLLRLPATSQTKAACPWLNEATALGILGGSVGSPMTGVPLVSSTACNFTYRDGKALRMLRITVAEAKNPNQTMSGYKLQCGSRATPLRGIGNEAVLCSGDARLHAYSEQVIGRVRNQVFTVTVSTSMRNDPSMGREALQEKAENVAEEVAGNLF